MKCFWKTLGLVAIIVGTLCIPGALHAHEGLPMMRPMAQQQGMCDELQVVFLVDQSGSMSGARGTTASDPNGLRFFGPAEAVNTLSSLRYHAYPNATLRVGMIHFGSQIVLGMPWTVLTATNQLEHQALQQQLAPYFQPIPEMNETNVLGAFEAASSLFDQAPPQADGCPGRVVLLLTDGEPYLSRSDFSQEAHMQELAQYVQQYMPPPDHQIYVIGIDETNQYWDRLKPTWDQVIGDPSHAVRARTKEEMGSLLSTIAEESTRSLRVSGAAASVQCISGGRLTIPPFMQQVRLTLFKPVLDLHLVVVDEQGTAFDANRSGVMLEGFPDEPIESLTVQNPQPGYWTVQTVLPAGAADRCQIRMLAFAAAGNLTAPEAAFTPVQFKTIPLALQIANTDGTPLPVYTDPMYALNMEAHLVSPSTQTQPVMLQAGTDYQYTGNVIPLKAGPHELQLMATSKNIDGSTHTIIDRSLRTFEVLPVALTLTNVMSSTLPQHTDMPLTFALTSAQQPVLIDLPWNLTATLARENAPPVTLQLTPQADGSYQAIYRLEQPGRYTLDYRATVETAAGPVTLGPTQTTFDVFPTTLVGIKLVNPSRNYFWSTDFLGRVTGLPLEIQLVDDQAADIGPGQLGATDPLAMFKVTLLDEQNNPVGTSYTLLSTGKPGLFRLEPNPLWFGQYTIRVEPATTLAPEYVWAESSWTKTVAGYPHPGVLVLPLLGLILMGAVARMGISMVALRKHPLVGELRVFEQMTDPLGGSYPKLLSTYTLPAKRNRVVFRGPLPIRSLTVTCPTEADAQARRAHIEVKLADGSRKSTILIPGEPPYLLEPARNLYIQKDPALASPAVGPTPGEDILF